jgi:hypothetical protein
MSKELLNRFDVVCRDSEVDCLRKWNGVMRQRKGPTIILPPVHFFEGGGYFLNIFAIVL